MRTSFDVCHEEVSLEQRAESKNDGAILDSTESLQQFVTDGLVAFFRENQFGLRPLSQSLS